MSVWLNKYVLGYFVTIRNLKIKYPWNCVAVHAAWLNFRMMHGNAWRRYNHLHVHSPYAFWQRVRMHSQVSLSTMHVQVCTLDRCCEYQLTHLLHARYKMCICAMYTHVYMHMYMCIYMCMHVYIYICMYVYTGICIYIYGCVYVCMCMYMCIYIYMYVYVCVYIYVYVSISHVCAVCFI